MTDDLITAVERSKKGAVVTLNGEEKIFVILAHIYPVYLALHIK